MPHRFRLSTPMAAYLSRIPEWQTRHIALSIDFFLEGEAELLLTSENSLPNGEVCQIHVVYAQGTLLGFCEAPSGEVWLWKAQCAFAEARRAVPLS